MLKSMLITGATSGIGKAIAEKFASEGFNLILTGRNANMLEQMQKALKKNDQQIIRTFTCDLRNTDQIDKLVEFIQSNDLFINVLVNNAGILVLKPFLELTIEEFDSMWSVNMRALFYLTQKILPRMIENREGTIINISSLAGKNGFVTGTGYGATKWAVRGFSASLMQEVRKHNIRVITIFPGSVDTPMIRRAPTVPDPDTIIKPDHIAEIALSALSLPVTTTVSEIDIRPTNPSYLK